jgi:hypothetical protein
MPGDDDYVVVQHHLNNTIVKTSGNIPYSDYETVVNTIPSQTTPGAIAAANELKSI